MANISPVRDCFLLCGEGRLVKNRINLNHCSFCFKIIEFNSVMVVFKTTSCIYNCHVECEKSLRHKIEDEYWDNHENEKRERIEIDRITKEIKTKKRNRLTR